MGLSVPKETLPILPKTHDVDLAGKASVEIASFLSRDKKKDIMFAMKRGNRKEVFFYLSPAIVNIFFRALVQISAGHAVTIVPIHAELTTQEAANLLNVSRPYLIRLLEQGKIPFHKVGRHRRIMFKDLLKYREKSKEKSRKTREALTKQAQDLDMGY